MTSNRIVFDGSLHTVDYREAVIPSFTQAFVAVLNFDAYDQLRDLEDKYSAVARIHDP